MRGAVRRLGRVGVAVICAWVLWEQETWLRPDERTLENWSILRTYDARAECRADVAKLMSQKAAWRLGYEDFGEDKVIQKHGVVQRVKRVVCVPGTLDPRPRPERY